MRSQSVPYCYLSHDGSCRTSSQTQPCCEASAMEIHSENQFFRVKPSDREAVLGENVDFKCHIGNREGDVQWSKDGFLLGFDYKIPGYPRYSMEVNEDKGIYNLRIQKVEIQDEGEYQCQVGPAFNNTPIRAGASLKIMIAPTYISINGHGESSIFEVKQNAKVQLKCESIGSRPPAQIKWYRNNTEVTTDSVHVEEKEDKNKRYVVSSYLSIRPTVADNGAKFACETFHKALDRRLRAQVILSVLHPPGQPSIFGFQEGDVVRAGDALTLMCVTQGGNPQPDVIWYRGNAQIDASHYLMGEKRTGNNLTITITAADNGGSYFCKASNSATRDPPTAIVTLSVYHSASKLKISGPDEAARGQTITIHCVTDISNPKSKITWSVDGKEVGKGLEDITAAANGWITTSNLTITLTRQEPDLKLFTCYAQNPDVDGKIAVTHKLRVAYPPNTPTILGYDAGAALKVGDIQRFNCVALGGNPPATLKWFKGDREISAPVKMSGSGVSSELLIRIQLNDNGAFYRCEAHNPALKKPMSAFVRLTVHFPPAFVNVSIHPPEPKDGDNVTLTCNSGSSNPLSRVSWKKDGSFVRDHREETLGSVYGGIATRSRLSFIAKTLDDGSVFLCQAKSDIFKSPVSKTVTLRVRHKPTFQQDFQSIEVEERKTITVNLTADAYPDLVAYTWFKNGERLNQDSTISRVTARGPLFHVHNASREDSGHYHCHAENDEGSSNTTLVLNILYGASIVNLSRRDAEVSRGSNLLEGQEASFECWVEANPAKKELIKWRLNGISVHEGQSMSYDGGKRSILKIPRVSRDLRGSNLECVAHNGLGDPDVLAIAFDVFYKPLVTRSIGLIVTNIGRLRCTVDATGNVSIFWAFNGTFLRSSRNRKYQIALTRQGDTEWTSLLTVTNITDEDHGIYICNATNSIGFDSVEITLGDHYESTTDVNLKEHAGRFYGSKFWWIPGAAVGLTVVFLGCILIMCCMRKRSNRTAHEGCTSARHIDLSDLTADEVCNKLLLSADVKSLLLCAAEKQHIPLQDFKEHSVFTIEDAFTIDKLRARRLSKDKQDKEAKQDINRVKETIFEEVPHSMEKQKPDCPDILRNEKGLCLVPTKEVGDTCSSPTSVSPESPRYNSTPSGSTGSCLSVYHEKVPLRSLGADIEDPDLMKLHPIMILRMNEDALKYSET